MEPRPLRVAYAVEFLVCLVAFFECWSQLGGQGPLDVMPWWVKLVSAVAFSSVAVQLTAVAVRNEKFPPVQLLRWSLALVMIVIVIALTTYYFYLHEPSDDESGDEPVNSGLAVHLNACG